MTWISLSLLSAAFLGLYDVAKKAAVHNNAVPPVLLSNVVTAALLWFPLMVLSKVQPEWLPTPLRVTALEPYQHALLMGKSILVGASWTCALFALKQLPIAIATTIRATSPVWTVIIAILAFGERPSSNQLLAISVILVAFFAFSRVGKQEGITFHRDRWVALMAVATVLGSFSALYDKYLLQTVGITPACVQAWFSVYLVPVMCPLWLRWILKERQVKPFQWRLAIPLIAIALLIADFAYFTAISYEGALISIISPIRRTSIVIPFVVGVLWFGERNWRPKLACIMAILAGVYWLSLRS